MLRYKAAETLTLAIHELATNSVKFGARRRLRRRRVPSTWSLDRSEEPAVSTWSGARPGSPVNPQRPMRDGFGNGSCSCARCPTSWTPR